MLKNVTLAGFFCLLPTPAAVAQPHFACGIRTGETTSDSAIVWVRLTERAEADFDRLPMLSGGLPAGKTTRVGMPENVVPGMSGEARLRYWPIDRPARMRETAWIRVDADSDYIHQFQLSGLQPGTEYQIEAAARESAVPQPTRTIRGRFRTAPSADQAAAVRFVVSTCQAVRSIDSGVQGHRAYRQMQDLDPDFFVHTGDFLYYDKVPLCQSEAAARAKWNLMFAYHHNRRFLGGVSSYFMKDDHDTLKNDCWPGQRYGELTFEDGLAIFRQQVSMGQRTWRTVRWGRDLQIWMTEHRDYRSPNPDPDGPDKTILGAEQKRWLLETLAASDATFRIVITPGPLVGPDKPGKADNHSNPAFAHEGRQLREFLASQPNTLVICGDRHWQYCSQDPQSGLPEMGCGPINDEHNFGGNPGYDADWHRYFSARGGFLMVTVEGDQMRADWYHASDPHWRAGRPPAILHTELFSAE